jgi:hypothetical protein
MVRDYEEKPLFKWKYCKESMKNFDEKVKMIKPVPNYFKQPLKYIVDFKKF